MGLSSTLIYTSELILCSTICVPSATRHNIRWYTNEFKYNLRDKLDINEIIDKLTVWDYGKQTTRAPNVVFMNYTSGIFTG